MLGAIYIGLSGMDAYEKGLQAISNNVANLNTDGYKETSVSFSDMFSYGGDGQTYLSNGGEETGNGVTLGTPGIDFTQGDLRQSNGDLDLAIQGSGFLVMLDGDKTVYARTGQFVVGKDGYIIEQGSDRRLAVLDAKGHAVAVNLDTKKVNPPSATTTITFNDNLSSGATTAQVTDIAVYDSTGAKQVWTVNFARDTTTPAGNWTVTVNDANGRTVGTSTLKFVGGTVDPTTEKLVINDTPAGADPLAVTLDFSAGVTSFSSGTTSTISAASVDGRAAGELTSTTIDADGQVKLSYSNGQTVQEGAVAIADFRDPQQLERLSGGLYTDKGHSPVSLRASGADGIGTLVSKQIEASNVDLSQAFGDLILVQRGFQASSQVVSISNDMIQQLFGMRGQG